MYICFIKSLYFNLKSKCHKYIAKITKSSLLLPNLWRFICTQNEYSKKEPNILDTFSIPSSAALRGCWLRSVGGWKVSSTWKHRTRQGDPCWLLESIFPKILNAMFQYFPSASLKVTFTGPVRTSGFCCYSDLFYTEVEHRPQHTNVFC